jgi:hypothetical protein
VALDAANADAAFGSRIRQNFGWESSEVSDGSTAKGSAARTAGQPSVLRLYRIPSAAGHPRSRSARLPNPFNPSPALLPACDAFYPVSTWPDPEDAGR